MSQFLNNTKAKGREGTGGGGGGGSLGASDPGPLQEEKEKVMPLPQPWSATGVPIMLHTTIDIQLFSCRVLQTCLNMDNPMV